MEDKDNSFKVPENELQIFVRSPPIKIRQVKLRIEKIKKGHPYNECQK